MTGIEVKNAKNGGYLILALAWKGGTRRLDGKGEAHVRFWEGLGVKLVIINLVDIQDFVPYSQLF